MDEINNTQKNTQNNDLGGAVLQDGNDREVTAPSAGLDLNVLAENKQNISETVSFEEVGGDTQTLASLEQSVESADEKKEEKANQVSSEIEDTLATNAVNDLLSESGVTVIDSNETDSVSSGLNVEKPKKSIEMPIHVPESPVEPAPEVEIENSSEPPATDSLEKEFQKTFETAKEEVVTEPEPVDHNLNQEKGLLSGLLTKIKNKVSLKKNDVKSRIETLRKEKETIQKELEDIKELEETEHKISEKIQRLEEMDTELDALTNEAESELKQ